MSNKVNKLMYFTRQWVIKLFIGSCLIIASCRTTNKKEKITDRAFYYWKSNFNLSSPEKTALEKLQVKKVYIKFFDVVWNTNEEKPLPVAKIQFNDSAKSFALRSNIKIIPTVFISNDCLKEINDSSITELGNNIHHLLTGLLDVNTLADSVEEVQFDCDWTASTKNKYFSLLQHLKSLPFLRSKQISATIRLYQCKYRNKTGIPPVNRGLLMCYNMGNLKDPSTNNSIIETEDLKKYISDLNHYPLPMDIALPLFEWKVLFRNHFYQGLIEGLPDSLLSGHNISRKSKNRYEIQRDTVLNGYEFKQGDVLRSEESKYAEVIKAAEALRPKLSTIQFSVVLFHLDSSILQKYPLYELEEMYHSLR